MANQGDTSPKASVKSKHWGGRIERCMSKGIVDGLGEVISHIALPVQQENTAKAATRSCVILL